MRDELKECLLGRLWLGRPLPPSIPVKERVQTTDYGLRTTDCGLRYKTWTTDYGLRTWYKTRTGYKIVRIDTANIKSCFISAKHLDF